MKKLLLLALLGLGLSSSAQAQCPGVNCTIPQTISIPVDGQRATYAVGTNGTALQTTGIGDAFVLCGSATKVVRVTKAWFGGRATTAVGADVSLVKYSTAPTSGASTTETVAAYDSNDQAATAVAKVYTGNPTPGTILGVLASINTFLGNLTTTTSGPTVNLIFGGDRPARAIVLRGVAQCLSINLQNVAYTGIVVDTGMEWTEE